MESNTRSFGLDLIRAVAIVLVLIAHFAKIHEYFGFWGVELFFALSGFLIGQIIWRNYATITDWTFSHVTNFWSRRWWRTLPNYYLFLIVSMPFTYFMLSKAVTFNMISDFLWFGQDLITRNREFYGVSWSLCIEEWFYILFPLSLFVFSKIGLDKKKTYMLTLIVFILSAIVMRILIAEYSDANSIRTITFARLDAIAYGVLISFLYYLGLFTYKNKIIAFVAGSILLLSPIVYMLILNSTLENLRQNLTLLLLVPLGASLIIPLVTLIKAPAGSFSFITIVVEKLSLWSYSIYLSHIPIMFLFYYLLSDIRDNVLGNLLSKLVGAVVTIAVSGIIFTYFETPLTKQRPKEIH